MSNEIVTSYVPGRTLYANVRTLAGLVWYVAGQVFETWGTAGRAEADYKIAVDDKLGTLFMGDFDVNIADDIYYVQLRLQIGGAPATTDPAYGGPGRRRWKDGVLYSDDTLLLNTSISATNATHTYTVTDGTNPIPDVLVQARLPGTSTVVQSATTDVNGIARFSLAIGFYDFWATKTGFSFPDNPDREEVTA